LCTASRARARSLRSPSRRRLLAHAHSATTSRAWIVYCAPPVVAVCCKFTAAAIAIKSPLSAVGPLQAAVCALQPSPSHFTPLHAELLKVCLLSKCYFAARPLLKQELLHVSAAHACASADDTTTHTHIALRSALSC
jgi:hypothetical protein